MIAEYKNITAGKVFIIDRDIDAALLTKAFFLRKGCHVFISHSFTDVLQVIGQVLPAVVIIHLSASDISADIIHHLSQAPGVQLVVCNNDVVYKS
jgi:hypothetical protein